MRRKKKVGGSESNVLHKAILYNTITLPAFLQICTPTESVYLLRGNVLLIYVQLILFSKLFFSGICKSEHTLLSTHEP